MRTNEPATEIEVESGTSLADMQECVNLQRAIWADRDAELIPPALFIVARKVGGQVLLAREGGHAVGFALAFPGFHGELRYLHSHMVGVLPEYQNRRLGRQIKLKQRELALAKNIPLIEWSFDPLAIRNAFFNIVRLGVVIRTFCPNFYGVTSSPLHGGLPTDRLIAEWWLSSPPVTAAMEAAAPSDGPAAAEIRVPAEIDAWKVSAPERVAAFQQGLREEFQARFAEGLAVTGFRTEDGDGIYVLTPDSDGRAGSR